MFEDLIPLEHWLKSATSKGVHLITGPCSVESKDQLQNTVEALVNTGLSISCLRAGIWKPRTRPNSFEGLGQKALPWLQEIKEVYKIPIAIEIASVTHLEQALQHDVDIIWIGARTTVNPFLVQAIADALVGKDIPVMIKNPVNPDLHLWIGAIERIYQAGIKKIAVIHRGFSTFEKSIYRNPPTWQIPIELKRLYPNIPLICDPSHITGKRSMLLSTAQKALDLNYDALMIESHINPDLALSDAQQQVTPNALKELLGSLQSKKTHVQDDNFGILLEEMRQKIDLFDHDLVNALSHRTAIVRQIGEVKRQNNVSILQLQRWKEILETRSAWAEEANISPQLIQEIYQLIHIESINIQSKEEQD